jgi:hypothetical protein
MTRRKEMTKKERKQRIANIFDSHNKNDEKTQLE